MKKHYQAVNLLLIEDNAVDVMVVERHLKSMRIANPLYKAFDGQEAWEMLQAGKVPAPRIILLDLNMPRMGGLEFLRLLRADPELSTSVVFVLTSSELESDIEEAYRSHVAGYIVKTSFPEHFSAVIALLDSFWKLVEMPRDAKPVQTTKRGPS